MKLSTDTTSESLSVENKCSSQDLCLMETQQVTGTVASPSTEVHLGQTLTGRFCIYSVLEFIGEGKFGKVARCQNLSTKETVAIKITKDNKDADEEVKMLEAISVLNADKTNIVKFFEWFEHKGQICLVFEMLHTCLLHKIKDACLLDYIRPVAKQLFQALDALRDIGILHTDIKPDNVMLVSLQDQYPRIKLIDFGNAILAASVYPGMIVQPYGYRAPEVVLGLPFDEAIDMWGVGCILAFLYLADNLFPVESEYKMLQGIIELLGQPEDYLLYAGEYTRCFFVQDETAYGQKWRIMTIDEYNTVNNMMPKESTSSIDEEPFNLGELVDIYQKEEEIEYEDRKVFVDLLKNLLRLDGERRISPYQALHHPFITMEHLSEHPDTSDYLVSCRASMSEPCTEPPFSPEKQSDVVSIEGDKNVKADVPSVQTSDGLSHCPNDKSSPGGPQSPLNRILTCFCCCCPTAED